jgi:hypothetical protein
MPAAAAAAVVVLAAAAVVVAAAVAAWSGHSRSVCAMRSGGRRKQDMCNKERWQEEAGHAKGHVVVLL